MPNSILFLQNLNLRFQDRVVTTDGLVLCYEGTYTDKDPTAPKGFKITYLFRPHGSNWNGEWKLFWFTGDGVQCNAKHAGYGYPASGYVISNVK